jgi:DNA-binding transcriptional LysR family regulator
MNLTQMRVFVETAEKLNFTAAAKSLYLSQQAVSRQISSVEIELRLKLFERTTKKVRLTEAGEILLNAWKKILAEHDAAVERASRAQVQDKLIVGIADSGGIFKYAKRGIDRFFIENPEVRLEYRIYSLSKLREMLIHREVDTIISITPEIDDIWNDLEGEVKTETVAEINFCVILSTRHHLGGRKHVDILDMNNEVVFVFSKLFSHDAYQRYKILFEANHITPKEIRFFDTVNDMELELYAGKGMTCTFDVFFDESEDRLRFHPIPKSLIPDELDRRGRAQIVVAWADDNNNSLIVDFVRTMVV